MDSELLSEARGHLLNVELIIEEMDLSKTFGSNGNTAAAIAYHVAESTKFWLSSVILDNPSQRDRISEFQKDRSVAEIKKSLNEAFTLIDVVAKSEIPLTKKANLHGLKPSPKIKDWNVMKVLIHISTHVSYHFSQLKAIEVFT